MGISLAKALTDTGAEEAGFDLLVAAKAMLGDEIGYSADSDLARFRALAETWDGKTIARLSEAGTDTVAPIFIIGLPRSGSTLIESVLSRHPDVTALGESPVCAGIADSIGRAATKAHVREMVQRAGPFLAERTGGRARVTDKLLANFVHVGLLAAAFPRARFVEAARDLRATCLSIFQNPLNPAGHPYSLDLRDLGRFASGYARLMDHWAEALGPRLYRCHYEALVAEPETQVRHLLDALVAALGSGSPGAAGPDAAGQHDVGGAGPPVPSHRFDRPLAAPCNGARAAPRRAGGGRIPAPGGSRLTRS